MSNVCSWHEEWAEALAEVPTRVPPQGRAEGLQIVGPGSDPLERSSDRWDGRSAEIIPFPGPHAGSSAWRSHRARTRWTSRLVMTALVVGLLLVLALPIRAIGG